jgi:Fic family protein
MEPRWIWQQPDWPSFRWDGVALRPALLQAAAERQRLAEQLDELDAGLDREALAALVSRESLSTAAIEGERLDPAEVRSSVARRFQLPPDPPGSSTPHASAQVEGVVQLLLAATAELGVPLTLSALHQWHADLFAAGPDGLRAIAIGDLRGSLPMQVVSGAIGRERLHFEAPPRDGLDRQLTLLLDWFNGPSLQLDGLVRAGLAHLWLVTLHPYDDGNGRLARALTDRALAQIPRPETQAKRTDPLMARALGLSARIQQQRQDYYQELERCQRGDLEVTRWLQWFLEQVAAAALSNQAVVAAVQAKALFWWRHRHSGFNARQQKLLNRLLDAEPQGFEGGMTLRKAIGLTKASRATAWRDLSELVELQALTPIGAGRSRAYRLGFPFELDQKDQPSHS